MHFYMYCYICTKLPAPLYEESGACQIMIIKAAAYDGLSAGLYNMRLSKTVF